VHACASIFKRPASCINGCFINGKHANYGGSPSNTKRRNLSV
jgi:hypothetical protein